MKREAKFAESIIRLFEPSNVLHLGCKNTKLIEELIIRGTPAFGLTSHAMDFTNVPDPIADRVFMVHSLVTDTAHIPVYDLIVTDHYIEKIPQEDFDPLKLFLALHGERYFFSVKTTANGGKHRVEWYQQHYPLVFFDER